ncbi:DUF1360 domain-containing protein [Shimazuella sp. AN120528]|uniref:DUF1360 domain-containing protein n=1 Tax=Shimazuella soli TaxID=1892854 RepID=UPI001F0E6582|nr:DUF1360 domain-containing protein [Shimazuella soli]MCH5586688.1 DUF1360 domain-containing protein [Shimazuella soli]
MLEFSWFQFFVFILASFRFTHLIVFDEITSIIRDPFVKVTYEPDDSGQVVRKIHIIGTGWRHTVGIFLSCHWCVGIWSSALLFFLYLWFPASYPLHLVLAIAGAAAFIESKLYFG